MFIYYYYIIYYIYILRARAQGLFSLEKVANLAFLMDFEKMGFCG